MYILHTSRRLFVFAQHRFDRRDTITLVSDTSIDTSVVPLKLHCTTDTLVARDCVV